MINTFNTTDTKCIFRLKPKCIVEQQLKIQYLYYEIYALSKRLYIQLKRRPSSLISGIVQPLLWLILFGALFQNAPVGLFTSNIQYMKFLSPGIIVFTAFTGAINAGLPLIFDREFGFLNRLLTSPIISKDSLLISSMVFIGTITFFQTLIIIIFSLICSYNLINLYQITLISIITLLITLSTATLSICLAFILPGHIEFLALTLLINLPTLFSSTALAPLSFMPYWLQIIASINPLTYAIESIRYLYLINHTGNHINIIRTVWFNIRLENSLYILCIINIISFSLVKHFISYKCD